MDAPCPILLMQEVGEFTSVNRHLNNLANAEVIVTYNNVGNVI